jgi:undecaprenyl-diphosphatase
MAFLAVLVSLSGNVGGLDLKAVTGADEHRSQPFTDWIFAVTTLGGNPAVILVTALAVAGLSAVRHWRGALALALSVALTQIAVTLLKLMVERPRPPSSEAAEAASGYSFPSGHSATSMALYALLGLLCARAFRGWTRGVILLAGAGTAFAVGASRVYLGVHYPTDVMAGWLIGAALALLCFAVVSVPGRGNRGPATA